MNCELTSPFEDHDWVEQEAEYGSLASGGSYDVYKCSCCGKISYSAMAD